MIADLLAEDGPGLAEVACKPKNKSKRGHRVAEYIAN